jgi:hypothetical protein
MSLPRRAVLLLPLPLFAIATLATRVGGDLAATSFPAKPSDLPAVHTIASIAKDPALRSVGGKEFEVYSFEAQDVAGRVNPDAQRILIQGGLHGNEEAGSRFVLWLARRYSHGESMLNLLPRERIAIDFLPYANPDGTQVNTRYNAHGVNLNRNFGVLWGVTKENPGSGSFSEPETTAIKALFKARRYMAAVDVHGYINWVVSPSAPDALNARGVKTPDRARVAGYSRWVDELREHSRMLPGYQLKTGAGLGDGGAFEDWAYWSEGTFAYCLELETFQRFVRPYRADFNDITQRDQRRSVDLFARYETFVYRTFDAALRLHDAGAKPSVLAVHPSPSAASVP